MIQNGNNTSVDKNGQFDHDVAVRMIGKIIIFLRNVMTETLVKRIAGTVFIVVGVCNDRVTELTGLCGRSIRELRKKMSLRAASRGVLNQTLE
jgi:hypothetical protein